MSTWSEECSYTCFKLVSVSLLRNYGNIKQVGFRVHGYLKIDFFAIIRKKIKNALKSSSEAATRAIDNAMRKVNSKKAAFDKAIGKLNSAQGRVNSAKGAFDRAIKTLRHWQRKVRNMCSISRCGSGEYCVHIHNQCSHAPMYCTYTLAMHAQLFFRTVCTIFTTIYIIPYV